MITVSKKYFLLFFFSLTTFLGYSQSNLAWTKNVGARKIPSSKKIYWVNDFGLTNDTSKVVTKIIQQAIDKCAANGGGVVADLHLSLRPDRHEQAADKHEEQPLRSKHVFHRQ